MHIICASPSTGILVPIPQYPLYTASLSLLNAKCVPYYLDEASAWATDLSSIEKALAEARKDGTDVRAIVVINPGNPTGGSLKPDQIKQILQFAAKESLVVLADEVYQTNVFTGNHFISFKKCLRELQAESSDKSLDTLELASLHSISKGMVGECGHRGGYMELLGFDEEVVAQIYKFISIQLCPPVIGQCMVEMMVHPPVEGEPSYALYKKEYDGISAGLEKRANALYEAFKAMEGVSCASPAGSMYLFPSIKLPEKAMRKAEEDGKQADAFYVGRLLDATGVCMVPGSGFGQKEGTFHFRTTFLAPGTEWVERIRVFHEGFMKEFSG
jgi:alanine transaminase